MTEQRHQINIDGTGRMTIALAFYPTGDVGGGGGGTDVTPTGTVIQGFWVAAPTGYLLLTGTTIGSAASSATYANAAAADLFTVLWNSISNTYAAVSGGRGVSAGADFAANKRLTLPDMRERAAIGFIAASTIAGVSAVLGAILGESTHVLTEAELAPHTHQAAEHHHEQQTYNSFISTTPGGNALQAVQESPNDSGPNTLDGGNAATSSTGSGTGHNNVQKSICINFAIKL